MNSSKSDTLHRNRVLISKTGNRTKLKPKKRVYANSQQSDISHRLGRNRMLIPKTAERMKQEKKETCMYTFAKV